MEIGIIGLGKMGAPLAINIAGAGHQVIGYDINQTKIAAKNVKIVANLEEFLQAFKARKIIWLMLPAGDITEQVLNQIFPRLSAGDIVIDGGNAHYQDSIRRAEHAKTFGLHYLDVGTSGGISGAGEGACLMIGGEQTIYQELSSVFEAISVEDGCLYAGQAGSGHFLKMVHNGIEYGMMQSIAEGFEILEKAPFDYDLAAVAKNWNHGSVIRSWLMELSEQAFIKDAHLAGIKGVMHASGEGQWTLETALDLKVPTPVIGLSLMMRYRSLEENTFTGKVVAALRNEFGGHQVEKDE